MEKEKKKIDAVKTKKQCTSIDIALKIDTTLHNNIRVPISEKRAFFNCLCCGQLTYVEIAGNIIDVLCEKRKSKKAKPRCKKAKSDCLGINFCDKRDNINAEKLAEMTDFLKTSMKKMLDVFIVIYVRKQNETRKIIAETYYPNEVYTVDDFDMDGDDYIKIRVNRKREKKAKEINEKR